MGRERVSTADPQLRTMATGRPAPTGCAQRSTRAYPHSHTPDAPRRRVPARSCSLPVHHRGGVAAGRRGPRRRPRSPRTAPPRPASPPPSPAHTLARRARAAGPSSDPGPGGEPAARARHWRAPQSLSAAPPRAGRRRGQRGAGTKARGAAHSGGPGGLGGRAGPGPRRPRAPARYLARV